MESEAKHWYALNVRYVKAGKFEPALAESRLEHFIPSLISNMLFIRSSIEAIDKFRERCPGGSRLRYMRSRDALPIYVSDPAMQTFITICRVCEQPVVLNSAPLVRLGARVRVKEGPLAGLEGHVVRIRKQKRVLVNIENVIWAATGYLSPDQLEILD